MNGMPASCSSRVCCRKAAWPPGDTIATSMRCGTSAMWLTVAWSIAPGWKAISWLPSLSAMPKHCEVYWPRMVRMKRSSTPARFRCWR
ncbi:hypothetical protein D3C78_1526560 [compost metagenome]